MPPLSDLCSSVAGSLKRANNTGVQSQERIEEARGRENARSQILEKRGRRPGLLLVNTQRCLHKGQAALQRGEPTLDGREAVARGELAYRAHQRMQGASVPLGRLVLPLGCPTLEKMAADGTPGAAEALEVRRCCVPGKESTASLFLIPCVNHGPLL